MLGTSPGASTSVKIMLDVLVKAFPKLATSEIGKQKLCKIVPFYNERKQSFRKSLSFYNKDSTEKMFEEQLENSRVTLELN